MNEEERADWLARAMDDLLARDRSRPKEPPPPALDKEELNALMRIARARADSAHTLMHTSLQYEGEVWQRVIERLDRRRTPRVVRSLDASEPVSEAEESAAARELEQMEIEELREIARMRRMLAERAAAIAEAHREQVWRRVQARLQGQSRTRWVFRFFRPRVEDERLASAIDQVAAGHDVPDSGEEETDSLVAIARTRRYWSQMTRRGAEERQDRLWDRVSGAIGQGQRGDGAERRLWPRLAVAGALGAVVIAALGPLPATGFAHHPVAAFLWSMAEHIGFREVDQPPPALPPVDGVTQATDITAAEASQRLGVPLSVPAEAPAEFELTSSRFFELPLTAQAGGTFALTYAGADGAAIVIYQERASGDDFAVDSGAATDVALSDGTAATYVEGMWQAVDGRLVWSEGGAQSLVFEREGTRTTIQYTGPGASATTLFELADSLAAPAE